MNNSEQTPNLEQNNTEAMFDKISYRMQVLTNHKDELLHILNTFESAAYIISEIQHWSVITQTEHTLLKKFIEDRWLSTEVSSIYKETYSHDKEWTLNYLNNFTQFVDTYPYVVDADQVSNIHKPLSNDIVCIRKDNKIGIIKKWIDGIEYLLSPDTYTWVLTTTDDEYEKYGVVEIVHHIGEKGKLETDYTETTFLQVWSRIDDMPRWFDELWIFNLVTKFDKDNIAIAIADDNKYCFVHKHFVDRNNLNVYKLGSFTSDRNKVEAWFDQYNSFAAEGKITYKKKYDKDWKFNGITIFKKSLIGKEELIWNYNVLQQW